MPVTAKLSRKFYERFGDELTNELVEWFNAVDATYRSDLRDLNEANFGRFDATLRQQAAELDAKLEKRFAELDAKFEKRFGQLDSKIAWTAAELRETLTASESRQLRWMFIFWTGTVLAMAALFLTALHSR